jgi:hypothetical protein
MSAANAACCALRSKSFKQEHAMSRSFFGQQLMVLFASAWLAMASATAQPTRDRQFACAANELAKLLASDGAEGDGFGRQVAISGDITVVGARGDDDNGDLAGSAYILRWDGASWLEEAKLLASDGQAEDFFGTSVAVSGNVAVIGAEQDNDNGERSGSAYVFRYDGSTWIEEAKLLASDGAAQDYFGRGVALAGDIAVIGAIGDGAGCPGSAYVFRYDGSTWVEEAKLIGSDLSDAAQFGNDVSMSGDIAVIGARSDDDNGTFSGSAFVFRYDGSTWFEEAKLLPSDGAAGDRFGYSVAAFEDWILVGAPDNEPSGAAYVFRYDGSAWFEEVKLQASDGATNDEFGAGVALARDTAVIVAPRDDDNGEDSGSAYVFRYDGLHWLEQAKLLTSDGAPDDWLGMPGAVALCEDVGIVGALRNDDFGTSSGSAYVFHGLSDCNANGDLDICDINNGTSEDANGNGIPDECDCWGDLDGDSDIDLSDLAQLLAHYGMTSGATYDDGDIDLDGDVDLSDLAALLAVYGTTCD